MTVIYKVFTDETLRLLWKYKQVHGNFLGIGGNRREEVAFEFIIRRCQCRSFSGSNHRTLEALKHKSAATLSTIAATC